MRNLKVTSRPRRPTLRPDPTSGSIQWSRFETSCSQEKKKEEKKHAGAGRRVYYGSLPGPVGLLKSDFAIKAGKDVPDLMIPLAPLCGLASRPDHADDWKPCRPQGPTEPSPRGPEGPGKRTLDPPSRPFKSPKPHPGACAGGQQHPGRRQRIVKQAPAPPFYFSARWAERAALSRQAKQLHTSWAIQEFDEELPDWFKFALNRSFPGATAHNCSFQLWWRFRKRHQPVIWYCSTLTTLNSAFIKHFLKHF